MDDRLAEAIGTLSGDELYVVAAVDIDGQTESQAAYELTRSRPGSKITRDWVHRRRRTAHDKLRRALVA